VLVTVKRNFLNPLEFETHQLDDGLTLQQCAVALELPDEFFSHGVAFVGDACFYPEDWKNVKPKHGIPINMGCVPADGDSLQSILPIAIVFAQFAVGASNPFLGALIGVGGSLLMAALAPKAETPQTADASKSRQLGQSGFSDNLLKVWDQIPTGFGRKRVSPNQIVPTWVDLDNDNAIVRGIVALSGRHAGSQFKVNGTEPGSNVTLNFIEGDDVDGALQLYTVTPWQRRGGGILPRHIAKTDANGNAKKTLKHSPALADVTALDLPSETRYRLGDSPDRVIVDFLLPKGLHFIENNTKNIGVPIRIVLYDETDGTEFVLPELHLAGKIARSIRAKLVLEFAADPGGLTNPGASSFWTHAYAASNNQVNFGQEADTYFGVVTVATHVDSDQASLKLTIYIDPASVSKRKWTIGITVGAAYQEIFFQENSGKYDFDHNISYKFVNFFGSYLDAGDYVTGENQADIESDIQIEYITSIWNETPIDISGLCVCEIEALNTQVDSLSFIAERYVRNKWDGAAWILAPHVSSNPAELMYEVLTDAALNAKTLPLSIIGAARLGEWAQHCTDNEEECNAYIESGTIEEALEVLVHSGFAALRRSETWSVYIDKDRSADPVVQIYSPRNSRNFRHERHFENRAQGKKITFDDETNDYQTTERIVYDDDFNELTADTALIEAETYRGITQPEKIDKRAKHDMRLARLRANAFSLETNLQYLMSDRGSIVGISTDVISGIYDFARITKVFRQDILGVPKIIAVEVDDPLTMRSVSGYDDILTIPDILDAADVPDILAIPNTETTGIAIQTRSGDEITGQTNQSRIQKIIRFNTPLDDDADVVYGCAIFAGEVANIYYRALVLNITPSGSLTAKLTMTDDASAELFA